MTAHIILGIGLEYVDTIFQTVKSSDFAQYTLTGTKSLAVLLFLINILKKYQEGATDQDGYSWGLKPADLIKNFSLVIVIIFSTQILGFFDSMLVSIESSYRDTAPALLPLQMQDIPIEEDVNLVDAAKNAMTLLYEALVTPLFGFKIFAFILGIFLWLMDLFIYPLFLAERFFLLGIMQVFFPLLISLAVFEKFRSLAYGFFKTYTAIYMLVPAFFLVNVFINAIYTELTTNFWSNLFGTHTGETFFAPIVQLGTMGFIVFLKFKLYRRAISFTIRLFTQ